MFVSYLFLKNGIVAFEVLFAFFRDGVHFSGSTVLGLSLTCEETFFFQVVQHGVEGAVSEFDAEVAFDCFLDFVAPHGFCFDQAQQLDV